MKKKLFGTMVVVAAMFAGYSAYDAQNENKLSRDVFANVEALANNETKPTTYEWSGTIDCDGIGTGDYEACIKNGSGNSCNEPGATTCDCGVNCN